jgi:hypothetical protein
MSSAPLASYIAFKSLRVEEDGLYSPTQGTRWDVAYVPALGRLTYSLRAPSLEDEQGIYGATPNEALQYLGKRCHLFLVMPSPDPDTETELCTDGWRTTCAIVIGKAAPMREAARLVLASHQAGYPQVEGILEWAETWSKYLAAAQPYAELPPAEALQRIEVRRLVRATAMGQSSRIQIGRSSQEAGVTWSTPIELVAGDRPPKLAGKPCLVTNFRRGRFSRVLYTPSTLRIQVGEEWLRQNLEEKT